MSTCEDRLSQVEQLADAKLKEEEILGDQFTYRREALMRVQRMNRRDL